LVPAFDATPVNRTGIGGWISGFCFTFMLLPLGHRHKDCAIHTERHKDDHIDGNILRGPDVLLRIATGDNLLCHLVATDGDNGIDEVHKTTYGKYKEAEPDLAAIVAMLTNGGENDMSDPPISDLLHLLKNARAR
jgi:hypothetical protein